MDKSIEIVSGKQGWHLKVNGLYISQEFGGDIRAIACQFGVPYGATEWVSVQAIRSFWNKYRTVIVHSISEPYRSVWGTLEKIT